ncbi:MAG: response regulator receiver modulated CheW protein [Clostridia bacterium]|jgi:two-component system chemotaxis response regulator CheV|nr:response regulator receiver modulated CheW protein [Clostridia bacterium]
MDNSRGILLESGTNELEIVEFKIGGTSFGINVAKVREIMPYETVTKVPNSHPCIKGIFKPRETIITVVDLPRYLNMEATADVKKDMLIIANFNKLFIAFQVQGVVGIHRISWTQIEKPDQTIFGGKEGLATGIVKLGEKLIMILDFEKIIADISPQTGIQLSEIDRLGPRSRNNKPIVIAEDSDLLAKMLNDALTKAGYSNLTITTNGQEAWNVLEKIKQSGAALEEKAACLITDIEMPQMDGHHLTKLVKEDEFLKRLPVVIFSSLINEEMKKKGETLGADAQITKPEIGNLVGLIDKLIL